MRMSQWTGFVGIMCLTALSSSAMIGAPSTGERRMAPAVTPLSDRHIVYDTCSLERDNKSCMADAGCNCGCLCTGARTYKNPNFELVCRANGEVTARIPVMMPRVGLVGADLQGCGCVVGEKTLKRQLSALNGKTLNAIFSSNYYGLYGAFSPTGVNLQGGDLTNNAGVQLNMAAIEYGVQLPGVKIGRGNAQLVLNPRGNFHLPGGNFQPLYVAAQQADLQARQKMEMLQMQIASYQADKDTPQPLLQQAAELQKVPSQVVALLNSYVFQSTQASMPVAQTVENPPESPVVIETNVQAGVVQNAENAS